MTPPIGLFQGFGVELEYMIVRRDDLSVAPLADELIKSISGEYSSEVELGPIAWCNELVLHVIELKTNGPAKSLAGLDAVFQQGVEQVNTILETWGCCLMPTAMHPWMDPRTEARLWPHEFNPVYESYNRIFGCQGHGWSNLQSLHMNLPFADGKEFGRLHAAIRLVIPIMPALAASSPVIDSRITGWADNRLAAYRLNQKRIPSIAGMVVPEAVFSPEEYQERILSRMYRDITPHDPDRILQHEWLNSRGAIPRFDRNTIEVRVLDIQESPAADLAIYRLIVELLQGLVEERWATYDSQQDWAIPPLMEIFEGTARLGGAYPIENEDYLEELGLPGSGPLSAREVWRRLFERLGARLGPGEAESVGRLLAMDTLAERIVDSLHADPGRGDLEAVYRRLTSVLASGEMFDGPPSSDPQL